MRRGFSLAALASACVWGVSSAALAQVTDVTVSANGWDTRTVGYGCAPGGCVPANVVDASTEDDSRWSCRPSYSQVDVCELTFVFDEPQDIFEIRMAMWKGNQRNRTMNIFVDGVLSTTVQTSGITLEYEAYELQATQASTILLQEAGAEENVWLSITGVQLMTDYDVDVSMTTAAPTGDDYVGCYNDLVADRVLTNVITDDALTPDVCAATCAETSKYFYGLQQGNECWCAGCDITERDTNTDYDRHGEGSCSTPCAGDSTSACGGDFAISLYQATTCLATPAPTPAIPASECPTGSTQAALEITVSWEDSDKDLELHVIEPGGTEVYEYSSNKLGDVGTWGDGRDGRDDPGSETYLTMNGLSAANDAVLGDYEIWAEGRELSPWTITARSGGELLWIAGGVIPEFEEETEHLTATVSSYAESDCTIDAYGKCPQNTYGSGGLPPCTACASGLVASGGSSYCSVLSLRNTELPEILDNIIVADAVGGFAGPGYPDLDGRDNFYTFIVTEGSESGTVSVSGVFEKDDGDALPASTALYLYIYNEHSPTDFERGQGVIDTTTGNFTATITDFPVGYSEGILSFVVLDPADGADITADDSVFTLDVVNEGCSDALRIKLEWDSNADLQLWVTDPNGDRVSWDIRATDIGYINNRNGGGWTAGNIDTGFAYGMEEYVLFSGLSGDSMLGEYRIFVRRGYASDPVAWTLTATIDGMVEWVEEGEFLGHSTTMWSYDDDYTTDDTTRRRLSTYSDTWTDDRSWTFTSYSTSFSPRTDVFTVNLESYDPIGC